ncbi:hypothetical protein Sfulv_25990 [Streptomyces fulvorobeus]|uniref:Uncharacterized protein n=1 Tax=Streptomyces fulvorobeus TaxID=284028 RepID=A0A7J0C5X2_9ACTN|nr:hypothetical protein Sfulv_25990 [Streptomyces fulvorobeus]
MRDVLATLAVPVLVLVSGVYAVCAGWWRRRHPAPPSPYTRQALRLAERATLDRAEDIVDGAYGSLAPLYGAAQPHPRRPAPLSVPRSTVFAWRAPCHHSTPRTGPPPRSGSSPGPRGTWNCSTGPTHRS